MGETFFGGGPEKGEKGSCRSHLVGNLSLGVGIVRFRLSLFLQLVGDGHSQVRGPLGLGPITVNNIRGVDEGMVRVPLENPAILSWKRGEPRFVLDTESRFGLGAKLPGGGLPSSGPRGPEVVNCGGDGE
jgi:hypothetical protein